MLTLEIQVLLNVACFLAMLLIFQYFEREREKKKGNLRLETASPSHSSSPVLQDTLQGCNLHVHCQGRGRGLIHAQTPKPAGLHNPLPGSMLGTWMSCANHSACCWKCSGFSGTCQRLYPLLLSEFAWKSSQRKRALHHLALPAKRWQTQ